MGASVVPEAQEVKKEEREEREEEEEEDEGKVSGLNCSHP